MARKPAPTKAHPESKPSKPAATNEHPAADALPVDPVSDALTRYDAQRKADEAKLAADPVFRAGAELGKRWELAQRAAVDAAALLRLRNDVAAIPNSLSFDERKRQLEAHQRAVVRVVASIQPPLVPGWSPPAVNENEVWAWQRLLDRLEAIDPSLARVEDIALYTVGLDGDRRQHFTTPEGAGAWTRVSLAAIDSLVRLIQRGATPAEHAAPRRSDWPTADAAAERAVSPLNDKLLDLLREYPNAATRPSEVAAEIESLQASIMPTRLRVLAEHGWPLERDPATPMDLAKRLRAFDPDVTLRMATLANPNADVSKLDPHAELTLSLWQSAERMTDADPRLPRLPARPPTGRERWAVLRVWCDSCAEADRQRGLGFGDTGNPLLEGPDIHPHANGKASSKPLKASIKKAGRAIDAASEAGRDDLLPVAGRSPSKDLWLWARENHYDSEKCPGYETFCRYVRAYYQDARGSRERRQGVPSRSVITAGEAFDSRNAMDE